LACSIRTCNICYTEIFFSLFSRSAFLILTGTECSTGQQTARHNRGKRRYALAFGLNLCLLLKRLGLFKFFVEPVGVSVHRLQERSGLFARYFTAHKAKQFFLNLAHRLFAKRA